MSNNMIESALMIAQLVHEGQVDKEGRPYILHVLATALQGVNDLEIITGLLKDSVTDSQGMVKVSDLWNEGFPQDVLEAVDALTRRVNIKESYRQHEERILENALACRVKLYELLHNLSPTRSGFADERRLKKMYQKTFDKIYKKLHINE